MTSSPAPELRARSQARSATVDWADPTPESIRGRVVLDDNLHVLTELPDACIDLIYVDPPFNTRKKQSLQTIKTIRDINGDRIGFHNNQYRSIKLSETTYTDIWNDYIGFLEPRVRAFHRVLKRTGSLYFHIDYREVHYCKILLDMIFGRTCFLNEVIWAYDYGARTKTRWPTKHDNILVYARDRSAYYFDINAVDRLPYMAPGLVSPEKAARGKTPTDTWWHTVVPTNGRERLGYPTQKPMGILRRIVQASCPPGGLVADFFAGSGTTAAAALEHGCQFLSVDDTLEAFQTQQRRFAEESGIEYLTSDGDSKWMVCRAEPPQLSIGTPKVG